jgi:hypothetical protein
MNSHSIAEQVEPDRIIPFSVAPDVVIPKAERMAVRAERWRPRPEYSKVLIIVLKIGG